jgi:hypothetical protein
MAMDLYNPAFFSFIDIFAEFTGNSSVLDVEDQLLGGLHELRWYRVFLHLVRNGRAHYWWYCFTHPSYPWNIHFMALHPCSCLQPSSQLCMWSHSRQLPSALVLNVVQRLLLTLLLGGIVAVIFMAILLSLFYLWVLWDTKGIEYRGGLLLEGLRP